MPKFAYVSILYGDNVGYCLGALVTGYSILRSGSQHDRVMMHTPDVPTAHLDLLSRVWNVQIPVEYVRCDPALIMNYETSRFKEVFTKLRCLSLQQYDKILLVDTDMLIMKNMDELFLLEAPAAFTRTKEFPKGSLVPASEFRPLPGADPVRYGTGINAGLVLLRPDTATWERVHADVSGAKPRRVAYPDPEQMYLTAMYVGEWHYIPREYNYQYGLATKAVWQSVYNKAPSQVYNIHYSSTRKPWKLLGPDGKMQRDNSMNPYIMKFVRCWFDAFEEMRKDGDRLDRLLEASQEKKGGVPVKPTRKDTRVSRLTRAA